MPINKDVFELMDLFPKTVPTFFEYNIDQPPPNQTQTMAEEPEVDPAWISEADKLAAAAKKAAEEGAPSTEQTTPVPEAGAQGGIQAEDRLDRLA
jgi:hypothetical protein